MTDPKRPANPDGPGHPEPAAADGSPGAGGSSGSGSGSGGSGASASGSVGSGLSGSFEGEAPRVSSWRNKRLAKFRLLSVLGQGAMGRVFLAEDTLLRRQVAVKVLAPARKRAEGSGGGSNSPGVSESSGRTKRRNRQFLSEAQAAAGLSHPHIVGVYELGETKGLAYIAMELVDGGDVKRLIDTGGALSPARACDLAADAAEGLAFAHEMGVVHRDVKVANLLITRQGRVKLADFGLADPGDASDGHRLRDGVIGTPACMSPEVAMGGKATPASDQYSLGCTLWHMLTGEPLFTGESFQHILEKQVRAVPPSLVDKVPGIPESLAEAVHRALNKDPAARHRSCEELARLLRTHAVSLAPEGLASHGSGTHRLAAVAAPGAAEAGAGARGGTAATWKIAAAGAAALLVTAAVVAGVMLSGGEGTPSPAPAPAPETDAQANGEIAAVDAQPGAPVADPSPAPARAAPDVPASAPAPAPGPPPMSPAAAPRLALAVQRGEEITVAGRLRSVARVGLDGRFTARFADAGPDGLVLFWGETVGRDLARAHGGIGGEGLVGPEVRVSGVPEFRFGLPALRILNAEAIEQVP